MECINIRVIQFQIMKIMLNKYADKNYYMNKINKYAKGYWIHLIPL